MRRYNTEPELFAAALRALARRSYSVHEMRQYLEARTEHKAAVRVVLARLRQQALLDDARYARQFARYRAEARRQGRYRIAQELRARGVAERHIEAALKEIFTEAEEATLLRARIERRLRGIRSPLDRKRLAALYRSLLRAGFPAELIRNELRRVAQERTAVPGDEN
ncbi:MAG: RecX family transcriptional regulator [Acidobacteriia bacterium]|jgi:regulatory protein|nr:RecX family transcriptional regulator [Terriglobia bacterium]